MSSIPGSNMSSIPGSNMSSIPDSKKGVDQINQSKSEPKVQKDPQTVIANALASLKPTRREREKGRNDDEEKVPRISLRPIMKETIMKTKNKPNPEIKPNATKEANQNRQTNQIYQFLTKFNQKEPMSPKPTLQPKPTPDPCPNTQTKITPNNGTCIDGKSEGNGMQSALKLWKTRCNENTEDLKPPMKTEGETTTSNSNETNIDTVNGNGMEKRRGPSQSTSSTRTATPTTRKGRSKKPVHLPGQIKITSFLEQKSIKKTPSITYFQNSSTINNQDTTVAVSSRTLMGNKTTEAAKPTGGKAEQLPESI